MLAVAIGRWGGIVHFGPGGLVVQGDTQGGLEGL